MTKQWILIALALLLFQGCSLEEDISKLKTPEWNGEIAAPIAKGSITVGQAINQLEDFDYLDVEQDGTLVFRAEFPLASWAMPDLVEIPDFEVPFIENSIELPFPLEGVSRLDLKAGTMSYQITSSHARAVRVEFRLSDVKYLDQEAIIPIVLDGTGTFEGEIDLNGYSFQPDQGGVAMSYSAYFVDNDDPAGVDQATLRFSGLASSYFEGRLPETTIEMDPDTLNFQADLGIDFSNLTLTEPKLEFIVESQVGIPNAFSFPSFGIFDEDLNPHDLAFSPFEEGASLTLPTTPGTWADTRFSVDPANSNIVELLDLGVPQGMMYQATIVAFPNDQPGEGFMTDEDSVAVRVETEAALAFQLTETEFSQDIDLDIEMIDLIRSGAVLLITENEIPLELDLQVFLLDQQGVATDSLFDGQQPILRGAEVDAGGFTLAQADQRTELAFDAALLEALDQASGLRLTATVSSTGNGTKPIRITSDQSLGFRLGVRAQ